MVPVRYSDQGSTAEAYMASQQGRTWKMMVLSLSWTARSRMVSNSALCWAGVVALVEGQSIFATVATQTPRSSRMGLGGVTEEGSKVAAMHRRDRRSKRFRAISSEVFMKKRWK